MSVLRKMNKQDLALVLEARNAPEVRKNMYTHHVISSEEHSAWYSRIENDQTTAVYIFEEENSFSGVVIFSNINSVQKTADWGFYASQNAKKGIGTRMEYAALNFAFEKMQLRKLNCEVLSFNETVIALHRRFGFKLEGVRRRHYFRDSEEFDIYLLSMTKVNWEKYLREHSYKALVLRDSTATDVGKGLVTKFIVSEEKVRDFANFSGDNNALHFSDSVAKNRGFKAKIAHGAILVSEVSKLLGTRFPGEGSIILDQKFRYQAPVYLDNEYELHINCISKVGQLGVMSVRLLDSEFHVSATGEIEVLFGS